MTGKILRVDHLGIAVKDPRQRLGTWNELLGLELERAEAVPSEGVRTWFLDAGGTHLELLEPLGEDGPIAKYLEKRGEGIHHLCLEVDDIEAVLARLAAKGVEPLPPGVRKGAGNCTVAFLHPKQTGGVLLELSQKPVKTAAPPTQPFTAGEVVVLYLREPRGRVFGLLRSREADGIAIEGLDLDAWEDWLSQWSRGEDAPLSPSLQFFPAARIEKLLADRDAPSLPSLGRQFSERTGRELAAVLAGPQD